MQDLATELTQLATMKSLWDVMGYPKLAGRHEAGPYYYSVQIRNGNGGHDQLLRTRDRQRALALLPTLPAGSYVAMFHSQTHAQVGEQGRADGRLLNVLLEILAELEACEAELLVLARLRDEVALRGVGRDLELAAVNNRIYVGLLERREQLLSQGRVIASACILPPESVIW